MRGVRLKKLLLFMGIMGMLLMTAGCGQQKKAQEIERTSYALNTEITIKLYGTQDEDILTNCFELCTKYENLFSRTRENSEIAVLNQNGTETVSRETKDLLEKGLYYSKLSGGAFDITIEPISSLWDFTAETPKLPDREKIQENLKYVDYKKVKIQGNQVTLEKGMGIDLGAIAKGYIADRIKDYLKEEGVESAIISLGGNILCVGNKTTGDDFSIAIRDPKNVSGVKAVLSLSDKSVVTSGDYERYMIVNGKKYHHILNPKTGYSYENGLSSVTIVSDLSVDGDGLSTTCFALGQEKAMELINSLDGVWAMFIDEEGNIAYSEGFQENIPCKVY